MTRIPIRINGAFRGQVVTGQQRYASEVSRRLLELGPDSIHEKSPSVKWKRSALRTWLWAQQVGFGRRHDEVLLTLTSRGPLWARGHAVVVHDLFVLTHREWFSRKYALTHIPVLWVQLWSARTIIAVSEPVAEEIRAFTRGRKPVFVAPNAPAEVFLVAEDELDHAAVMAKFNLSKGNFVLAVGSLDPRKNLESLVAAYQSLPSKLRYAHPLVIVGAPGLAFGRVELPEDATTRLLGYVTDQELAALYSSSRLVVFPTLDEGFGLPAVEALAAGARVLTSDIAVMRWVCRDFVAYVSPASVTSIADGLRRELEAEPDTRAVRLARRDYVRNRFSWTRTAKIVLENLATPPQTTASENGSSLH